MEENKIQPVKSVILNDDTIKNFHCKKKLKTTSPSIITSIDFSEDDKLLLINWLTQPLTVIPLTQIDKVERVTVTVDSIKKKKVPYQFEIFFKDIEFPNRFIKNAEKSNSGTNSYYNSQLRETAVGIEISQKDKKNYVSYIKTNAEALTKVGIKEHIEGDNNNTKAKGLSGSGSLTNRTVIWKKIKEKHIYAHENKLECEKWVFILNWLIDIHRDSS